jgi:hypothetical protein
MEPALNGKLFLSEILYSFEVNRAKIEVNFV